RGLALSIKEPPARCVEEKLASHRVIVVCCFNSR
ncbi:MAG: hypothetical protein ACI92S_003168, partial [Planctomycetaceae bacterium]